MDLRKGDFESAAHAAYPALLRAATVLCWSQSDTDDAVQETMLRAFKSYGAFRGDSSFVTWAYGILLRVAQAMNRRHSKTLMTDEASEQSENLPAADRALILDEEARCLIDAIRLLPERQREMITLHFLEELTYKQMAEALDVSIGTVKATIFQARASLRITLAKNGIYRKARYALS